MKPEEDLSAIDVGDNILDAVKVDSDGVPTFNPATHISTDVMDNLGAKLGELVAAAEKLAEKKTNEHYTTTANVSPMTLEKLQAHVQKTDKAEKASFAKRKDLTALPTADATLTLFTECDELIISGDIDRVLLGAETAARCYADKDARLAALTALKIPLDEAMSKLADAGVKLREDFIEFVEMAAVKRMHVCCLSRGLKGLIRQLLREEGLGHVEVLAHEMHVDRNAGNQWKVCMRDESETGHDKAETMRRQLKGRSKEAAKGQVVLVGNFACDFAPVKAGLVDCLCAPPGSALANLATSAGIEHRAFDGWNRLTKELLK